MAERAGWGTKAIGLAHYHPVPTGHPEIILVRSVLGDGLAAGDALNLASAIRQGADEFITSELPGKPMFRVPGIKVISLQAF